MTQPRRRYSRKTKTMAVIAAAVSSVTAVAEDQGIPKTTVQYWFDSPAFAQVRAKTREDLAAESSGMAHIVLEEIKRRIPEFEPRDLSVLLGILVDKGQLLAGHPTIRADVNLTEGLDDHEKAALRDAIDSWLKEPEPA